MRNTAVTRGASNMPGTLWMLYPEGRPAERLDRGGYHVASH